MEEEIESPHPLCVYGFGMRQFKENARAFEGWRVVGVGSKPVAAEKKAIASILRIHSQNLEAWCN